jgi:hypothetical protein
MYPVNNNWSFLVKIKIMLSCKNDLHLAKKGSVRALISLNGKRERPFFQQRPTISCFWKCNHDTFEKSWSIMAGNTPPATFQNRSLEE